MMILDYETLEEGKQLEAFEKPPITKVQLVQYAGASGDFNPLHTDDEFAQSMGMDGVVAHGMLVMGFLGEYLMDLTGEKSKISSFRMRFGNITVPGDKITCSGIVKKIYEKEGKQHADLELYASKSEKEVVGSGSAVIEFL